MGTLTINGNNIYNYFISGAKKLIYSEKALNSINVFPVADGDTGTNLALTMKMVIANAKKDEQLYKALSSISEAATENAYGNSGMIFAQFLNGFAAESGARAEISLSEFADIAAKATGYAYEAVASPKEGTILSVMRDWAQDFKSKLHLDDFGQVLTQSIESARVFVDQTRERLKVLMEHNVVDAGAKGFLIFLEGIQEFITKGEVAESAEIIESNVMEQHTNITVETEVKKNRYCSQFFIESDKNPKVLKSMIGDLGDSLVVTGLKNKRQIHIHTDVPHRVMQELAKEETILSQKIEDMKLTNALIYRKKHEIGLITDSIADVPQSFLDDAQVTVIPVNLICDSVAYLDKLTMTPELFYQQIDVYKMNPTSAQPSYGAVEKALLSLSEHYASIIGVFVSQKMSGTYHNAQKAAKKLAAQGKKMTMINSISNSGGEGMLLMEAARLIEKGESHEDIVAKLEKRKQDTRIYVSVRDLSHMLKGGRISKVTGFILSKIKLQPVISIDRKGNGVVFKKTLKQKAAINQIVATFKKDAMQRGIQNYAVVYSDKKEDTDDLSQRLTAICGKKPDYIVPISPVVGLNAGAGSFAVAYMLKEEAS
ncbi:MAG: DegV family protein [Eubacteriales bacterium]